MDISPNSKIYQHTNHASFYDCHTKEIESKGRTALDIYLELKKSTPNWVNVLMRLRNSIVSKLGLKDLGTLSNNENTDPNYVYKVGDRLGIFSIYALSDEEIILEDNDKHLTVKVSFFLNTEILNNKNVNNTILQTATVVHVKKWYGKLYMLFVVPAHKIIVPATVNKLT